MTKRRIMIVVVVFGILACCFGGMLGGWGAVMYLDHRKRSEKEWVRAFQDETERLKKENERAAVELLSKLSVSVKAKVQIEIWDKLRGKVPYPTPDNSVTFSVGIKNRTGRRVTALKGTIVLLDRVRDPLKVLPLKYDSTLEDGSGATTEIRCPFSSLNADDKRLCGGGSMVDVDALWIPEKVFFGGDERVIYASGEGPPQKVSIEW